ncbi:PAN2-PAN3 deadenylation complex catalytic subunit PAN2-like isoform X1, partial [Clarias magur]
MNFDGLDPGLGDYAAGLHEGLEPGLDSTLDPVSLLQAVELNPDAMAVPVVEGMYSELHSVASEVGVPVSATHFDLHEELLWIGNHRGHASSFFGPTMGRYSSFQVHLADDVRHIQSMDTGVLFLTKSNLKCLTRGGLVMFDYPMEEAADMHSLLLTDNNTVLLGGLQNYVTEVDLNTVQETQK